MNKWKDILYLWIGKIHIIKRLILSKLIYKFMLSQESIRSFFLEEKSKVHRESKEAKITGIL